MIEEVVPPGAGTPMHIHPTEMEYLYFVEGTFKAVVEEAVLDVVAGDCAFIPPGVVHGWCNVGETPGKLLFGFTPSVKGHKLTTVFEKIPEMDRKTLEDEYDVVVVAPPLTPDSPFLETGYKPED